MQPSCHNIAFHESYKYNFQTWQIQPKTETALKNT